MRLALTVASFLFLAATLIALALVVSDRLPLIWHKRVAILGVACLLLAFVFRGLSA